MPSPQKLHPTSPKRHQQSPYRDSPRRKHRNDVEAGGYFDRPSIQESPTRRPKQEAYIQSVPSPGTPRTPGNTDPTMANQTGANDFSRKRSLIRPERGRIDRDHPNYYYRQHAQNMTVYPSTTGNDPILEDQGENDTIISDETDLKSLNRPDQAGPGGMAYSHGSSPPNKVTKVVTGNGNKLQRKLTRQEKNQMTEEEIRRKKDLDTVRPPTFWNFYCAVVTFWCPAAILACFGKPAKAQQRAWREKMGLISIILLICAFVGFLTFGFTQAVCGQPGVRLKINNVDSGYMIFHGSAYSFMNSQHPPARGIPAGSNILYDLPHKYGGQDGSFFFQNVNGACKGLVTAAPNSDVPTNSNGDLAWYFPCVALNQDGSSKPNFTDPYYLGYACHTTANGRAAFYNLRTAGEVYFDWSDVKNASRNLMVYSGSVLDLDLLEWFNTSQVSYPAQFDDLRRNPAVKGVDVTHAFQSGPNKRIGDCLSEIIRVGSIDTESVGCIASKVVLYVSLVFILAIVLIKFFLALCFQWFFSRRFAASKTPSTTDKKKRNREIEDWSDDIYRAPPKLTDPAIGSGSKRSSTFLPTTSRFTNPYATERSVKNRPAPTTMASQSSTSKLMGSSTLYGHGNPSDGTLPLYDPTVRHSVAASRSSMLFSGQDPRMSTAISENELSNSAGIVHDSVVPQPPAEWEPFGYPLAHVICLVTAYSEGEEGLRTTLDSIATTDYPNSHKVILVVCDGMIRGHGENFTTPEIALGMMGDHAVLPEEVSAFSYVAVASGSKRHNMAKVYAGFYDYGENSAFPVERQQRVPMMVVVKCGTPDEASKSKPGNRGKRDSQIILMSFLQKVMFDERMTELEFEMFNGMRRITGISPDFYEIVLMVDADTKVFPDSLTHMISAMIKDPEIMGLCGETKIANKRASWVSMIQVFEYVASAML